MKPRPASPYSGVLVMDKPAGFTSFDVVAKLRGIFGTRRLGHGGTLDPMATGVLPVFFGDATRAVDLQPAADKEYEAVVRFGIFTDTGDITGRMLEQRQTAVTAQQFKEMLPSFLGRQQQLPPMYSAVKIQGKPLYAYARAGKEAPRKARDIEIAAIEFLEQAGSQDFRFRVVCSKGTYVRTLAEDMGKALGVPATLAALRRTRAGAFSLQDAHTFAIVQRAAEEDRLGSLLMPVEQVFASLPCASLPQATFTKLCHGVAQDTALADGLYRLYAADAFWGLMEAERGKLRRKVAFGQQTADISGDANQTKIPQTYQTDGNEPYAD